MAKPWYFKILVGFWVCSLLLFNQWFDLGFGSESKKCVMDPCSKLMQLWRKLRKNESLYTSITNHLMNCAKCTSLCHQHL